MANIWYVNNFKKHKTCKIVSSCSINFSLCHRKSTDRCYLVLR